MLYLGAYVVMLYGREIDKIQPQLSSEFNVTCGNVERIKDLTRGYI